MSEKGDDCGNKMSKQVTSYIIQATSHKLTCTAGVLRTELGQMTLGTKVHEAQRVFPRQTCIS